MKTKVCIKCGIEKPLSEFYVGRNACKQCRSQYHKDSYWENKEKRNDISKLYYEIHKDEIRRKKLDYYYQNKDKQIEKNKEWRKSDDGRASKKRRWFRRRTFLLNAICDLTAEQWEEIKESQDYRCAHCGKREPEITLTQDHIIPISKGGQHTKDNIQGLCKSCNPRKRNRIDSTAFLKLLKEVSL